MPDEDTDEDGSLDCEDLCDADPDKVLPGLCGCGVEDTDSDGDTVPDCDDLCPLDSGKTEPGSCGCGYVDEDLNENELMDCHEELLEIVPVCIEVEGQRSRATRRRSKLDVAPSPFLEKTRSKSAKNQRTSSSSLPTIEWRIINPNAVSYEASVAIEGSNEEPVVVSVGEDSASSLETTLIPGLNRAILTVDGVEHDRTVHTFEICKELPTSIALTGALKGKNGRELEGRLLRKMQRLDPGDIKIIATNYDTGIKHIVDAESPFNWMMETNPGRMKISLKSKYLRVTSKPKNYRETYERDQDGLHFAVRWDGARSRKRKRRKR